MISEDVLCEVLKRKFYTAIEKVDFYSPPPIMVFYSFVLYFRYKSYIKCAKTQEERDIAYLAFYQVRGTMWGGIIMGMFPIIITGGILFESMFK